MVVRIIEMLLEYICIIICLYKVAKIDFKFNLWMVFIFVLQIILFEVAAFIPIQMGYKFIIFGMQFVFTRYHLSKSWKNAINIYGTMLIILMLLQLVLFYLFKVFAIDIKAISYGGIIINGTICVAIALWKEKYIRFLVSKLNVVKKEIVTILFLLILFRIIYLCEHGQTVDFEIVIQFSIETVGLGIAAALWVGAENEKELKKKEIQMYEMYNRTFEETVITIRKRQHEFENHINAMKSLNYTIKNPEELSIMQEQYCDKVIKSSSINKLLKLNLNPVVIGFLYSKITNAEEKGISVEFQVYPVNIVKKIEIYEFVEIVGILFDNAVEALENKELKIIRLSLINEVEEAFSFEIANVSRVYRNEELELFWADGYSSKGNDRGIGLTRVKEIVAKNQAQILIKNSEYKNENYISFKVYFD